MVGLKEATLFLEGSSPPGAHSRCASALAHPPAPVYRLFPTRAVAMQQLTSLVTCPLWKGHVD